MFTQIRNGRHTPIGVLYLQALGRFCSHGRRRCSFRVDSPGARARMISLSEAFCPRRGGTEPARMPRVHLIDITPNFSRSSW